MPLSPPAGREPIHCRQIECRGYRRADGLWDIEGHLVDTKSYAFMNRHRGEVTAGEPVHEMWLRLTVDDDLRVHAAEAATDAGPYRVCPDITPRFGELAGLTIGPGWRKAIRERLGGTKGCTHLVELLGPIATTAFQTIQPRRQWRDAEAGAQHRPSFLDSCHAYRSDGEVVREQYPAFYRAAAGPARD